MHLPATRCSTRARTPLHPGYLSQARFGNPGEFPLQRQQPSPYFRSLRGGLSQFNTWSMRGVALRSSVGGGWTALVCSSTLILLAGVAAAQRLDQPELLYRMGDVLASSGSPRSQSTPVLLPFVQNDALCGARDATLDASGSPRGCALRYAWSREQLRTVLTTGAEHGLTGLYHTGSMYMSREPVGGDVPGQELAWSISGRRGLVMDLWWRGPTIRTTSMTLWAWLPTSWPRSDLGGFMSPVAALRSGMWTGGRMYAATRQFDVSGAWTKHSGMSFASRGPMAATYLFGLDGFFDKWHHLVVAVNPADRFNSSLKFWNDGFSQVFTCQTWGVLPTPQPPGVVANEPGLPPLASVSCDNNNMTLIERAFPDTVQTPMPPNASYATLRQGLDSWFNDPGVLDTGNGGVSSSLGIFTTDSPFTLGHRLTAADRSPAAALQSLPPVSGASLSCGRSEETGPFAGRVVCRAECTEAGHVPVVDVGRLCGKLGGHPALESVCTLAAATGRGGSGWSGWSVWTPDSGDGACGGSTMATWLPLAYSIPSGTSHMLGAVAGANASLVGLDRRDEASLASWARQAPWSSILELFPSNETRRSRVSRSSGCDSENDETGGAVLRCSRASPLVERYHELSATVVLQMCLGGLSVHPGFGDASSALGTEALNLAGIAVLEALDTLSGVPLNESWRVNVIADSYMTAETALGIARATGSLRDGDSAESLCRHPARDAFIHAYGQGNVSSCVCLHALVLPRHSPGLVAAGRALPEPIAVSAAHIVSTLGLAMSVLPVHTTALTPLAAVSNSSLRLLPVYRCGSSVLRSKAITALSAPAATKAALRAVMSNLDVMYHSQYGPGTASVSESLVPCDGTESESLILMLSADLAALAVYAGLVFWYVQSHGSLLEGADKSVGSAAGDQVGMPTSLLLRRLRRVSFHDSGSEDDDFRSSGSADNHALRAESAPEVGEPDAEANVGCCAVLWQTCILSLSFPVVTLLWGSCVRAAWVCRGRQGGAGRVGSARSSVHDASAVQFATAEGPILPTGQRAFAMQTPAARPRVPALLGGVLRQTAVSEASEDGDDDVEAASSRIDDALQNDEGAYDDGGVRLEGMEPDACSAASGAHGGRVAITSGTGKRPALRVSAALVRRADWVGTGTASRHRGVLGREERGTSADDRETAVHVAVHVSSSLNDGKDDADGAVSGLGGASRECIAGTEEGRLDGVRVGFPGFDALATTSVEQPRSSSVGGTVRGAERGGDIDARSASPLSIDGACHDDSVSENAPHEGPDAFQSASGGVGGSADAGSRGSGWGQCARRGCSASGGDRYLVPVHENAVDAVIAAPSVGMAVAAGVAIMSLQPFAEGWVTSVAILLLVYPVCLRLCVAASELLGLASLCRRVGEAGGCRVCEGCGTGQAAAEALSLDESAALGWPSTRIGGGGGLPLRTAPQARGRPLPGSGPAIDRRTRPVLDLGLTRGLVVPWDQHDAMPGSLQTGGTPPRDGQTISAVVTPMGDASGMSSSALSSEASLCFGCRTMSSLASQGGGLLGHKFALYRLMHPATMGLTASLMLFDARAMRMVFSGLCEPRRPRMGSLGTRLAHRSRASLGRVECVCVAPALVLLAVGLLLSLWLSDDAVCQSLSDVAVMGLVDREVPCEEDWLCSRVGCTMTSEGLWRVGLPVLHGMVWLLVGAWERVTSTCGE